MPFLTKVAFVVTIVFVFNQHSYSNTKVFVYDVYLLQIDHTLFKGRNLIN